MTQSTLWPEESPQAPQSVPPTRNHALTLNEAQNACENGLCVRRAEMVLGSYLSREGGRWKYHSSTGEVRNWIPRLLDRSADNWEIIPKEVAA